MKRKKAWIGAGSNLGDRTQNLQWAADAFAGRGIDFIRSSSLYASAPVGFESDSEFLNCVFEVAFSGSGSELLAALMEIEAECGRKRLEGIRHSDRTLDLDILLLENEVINTPELIVPHPQLELRMFVLEPLSELIPLSFHPLSGQTVKNLKMACTDANPVFIRDKPLFVNR